MNPYGIPDGYRIETRNVNRNGIVRDIPCRRDHLSSCEHTDVGWICDDDCPVEDMKSINQYKNIDDKLIDVERDVYHTSSWFFFKVKYEATRVSIQRIFINGRCRFNDFTYSRSTWYSGFALTKGRARRKLAKEEEIGKPQYV
jgi:hypothetical protein